jgi:hypothetical protein
LDKKRSADLMETPKHLIAMAASKRTAAFGKVSCAIAKNEARRCGVFTAQRDRRYSPKAATPPERLQVSMPGIIPEDAMAWER